MSRVKAENRDLVIHFPAEGRQIDYFRELEINPPLRSAVLNRQRNWQQDQAYELRYPTCGCCTDPKARFYVRKTQVNVDQDRFCLVRFPHSWTFHNETCFAHGHELPTAPVGDTKIHLRKGDLAPLFVDMGDPEKYRRKTSASKKGVPGNTHRKLQSFNAVLRRLGTELLDCSGVCSWHPKFSGKRAARQVNGLIHVALNALLDEPKNHYAELLAQIGDDVAMGPWSITDSQALAPNLRKILTFGFVTHVQPPTSTGARVVTLLHSPEQSLLIPGHIYEAADKNPQFVGVSGQLDHPLWLIAVAQKFGGIWKAHHVAGFRLSRVGLIPVESNQEERMVEFLIENVCFPGKNGHAKSVMVDG